MVVRKGEKRERLEKRQLYHQRVSSSFHPQNHTERARSPSYSLLFSRSLLFSFALSLPLSPLPLFLFSLALFFSLSLSLYLLSRSLFLFLSPFLLFSTYLLHVYCAFDWLAWMAASIRVRGSVGVSVSTGDIR